MITTVTKKSMVTIPAEVRRRLGIKPGWRLDWQPVEGKEEILVRVIPGRGELARRLLGAGRRFSPERDAVSELAAERANEEADEMQRGTALGPTEALALLKKLNAPVGSVESMVEESVAGRYS